jgi:hypothetical protein
MWKPRPGPCQGEGWLGLRFRKAGRPKTHKREISLEDRLRSPLYRNPHSRQARNHVERYQPKWKERFQSQLTDISDSPGLHSQRFFQSFLNSQLTLVRQLKSH